MSFSPEEAERILNARYDEPAKDPTDSVVGFLTTAGKAIAILSLIHI